MYDVVIADIAGEFEALERLIKKLPTNSKILCLGDLGDRGPRSKEVFDLVMKDHAALLGNHEHMMIDALVGEGRVYGDMSIWLCNGGDETLRSYGYHNLHFAWQGDAHKKHIEWMKTLPTYYEDERIFVSHAPWRSGTPLDKAKRVVQFGNLNDSSLIWNRHAPQRRDKLQLFGHNSNWGLREFKDDEGLYALCLDQSRKRLVTAYHIPTKTIFTEPYYVDQDSGDLCSEDC